MSLSKTVGTFISVVLLSNCIHAGLKHPIVLPVGFEWFGLIIASICSFKMKSLSRVRPFATPWTVAHQVSPSEGFSRQEYYSGLPFPCSFKECLLSPCPGGVYVPVGKMSERHKQKRMVFYIRRWGVLYE